MKYSNFLAASQLSIRASLAAGLAVAISPLLHLQYPIYALITAVLVTDHSPSMTRKLGIPRLAGTVLGATFGGLFSTWMQSGPIAIGIGILAAMFFSHLLRLHDAAKVAGYVCGIVVLDHGSQPWAYALFRLLETLLGLSMALIVSFVPKLIPIDKSI